MLLTELYGIPDQLSVLDKKKLAELRKKQKEEKKTREKHNHEVSRTSGT